MSLKQRKTKFKPGIKLNHNIDIEIYICGTPEYAGHYKTRGASLVSRELIIIIIIIIITIIILLLLLSLSLSLLLLLLLLLLYFNLKINNQAHF